MLTSRERSEGRRDGGWVGRSWRGGLTLNLWFSSSAAREDEDAEERNHRSDVEATESYNELI